MNCILQIKNCQQKLFKEKALLITWRLVRSVLNELPHRCHQHKYRPGMPKLFEGLAALHYFRPLVGCSILIKLWITFILNRACYQNSAKWGGRKGLEPKLKYFSYLRRMLSKQAGAIQGVHF